MHQGAHICPANSWLDRSIRSYCRAEKQNVRRKKTWADVVPMSLLSGVLAISFFFREQCNTGDITPHYETPVLSPRHPVHETAYSGNPPFPRTEHRFRECFHYLTDHQHIIDDLDFRIDRHCRLCRGYGYSQYSRVATQKLNPPRTVVPFWGRTTQKF